MAVFFCLTALSSAKAANGPISIVLETVKPGREGLEFSAHLAGTDRPLGTGLNWSVRTADGVFVYSSDTAAADVSTPPGDYVVDVQFGAGRLTRLVSLPEATRLHVDFALNAGGLRVVARAAGTVLPSAGARLRVFSLQDNQPLRLVALSATPGELLRLPEGNYRVESTFGGGNAKAVADVRVKAGRLTTLDINHKVGLAHLSLAAEAKAPVQWVIADGAGTPIASSEGFATVAILAPGRYTATAEIGPKKLSATFTVASGTSRDVVLGN